MILWGRRVPANNPAKVNAAANSFLMWNVSPPGVEKRFREAIERVGKPQCRSPHDSFVDEVRFNKSQDALAGWYGTITLLAQPLKPVV